MLSDDEVRALIARRAHEISQRRGDGEGDALGDWLTAETEVLASVRPMSVDLAEGDVAPPVEGAGPPAPDDLP